MARKRYDGVEFSLKFEEDGNIDWVLIAILTVLVILVIVAIITLCVNICDRLGLHSRQRSNQQNRNRNDCIGEHAHGPIEQNLREIDQVRYSHPELLSTGVYSRERLPNNRDRELFQRENPVFSQDATATTDYNVVNGGTRSESDIPCYSELSGDGHPHCNAFDMAWKAMTMVMERSMTKVIENKLFVYITKLVDHTGCVLFLDNMGISLVVPKGAVSVGESKIITLLLNWNLNDNPPMQTNQALVSPVVFVGPHWLKLNKRCILRYMHCSFDPRHIQVMRSETDVFSNTKWEVMNKPDEKSDACVFTSDLCQLNIDTFTLYTCLQCPPTGQLGKKWLQIAVFSEGIKYGVEHQQVRVYFLNKTNCALQWAINKESKFGGTLVCPEKLFLLSGTEKDVFIILKYVSRGWTVVDDSRRDRIPYLNIWHGHCPHVSVGFRRENPKMNELDFCLTVSQEDRENEFERVIAQIVQPEMDTERQIREPQSPIPSILHIPSRIIPQCLRTRLKVMLDVASPLAQNWKGLAEKIGYDGLIPFLETNSSLYSPTEVLLQAMEQKALTLQDLKRFLEDIGRTDAACVIRQFMEPEEEEQETLPKSHREGVENETAASDHNNAF